MAMQSTYFHNNFPRKRVNQARDYGLLNSILVGSNQKPVTAWKHTERNKHGDRKSIFLNFRGLHDSNKQ